MIGPSPKPRTYVDPRAHSSSVIEMAKEMARRKMEFNCTMVFFETVWEAPDKFYTMAQYASRIAQTHDPRSAPIQSNDDSEHMRPLPGIHLNTYSNLLIVFN
uniref:Uncharacterized protein n=1 Tax=Parascaris equorum TaxID=6256 RepID=A0A914RBP4_PAREQ